MAEIVTTLDAPRRTPTPAQRAAFGAVRARFERLERGVLWLRLPDGDLRAFGDDPTGPTALLAVHEWRFFSRLVLGGDTGAGESFMDGDWSSPDLVALVRLFLANESALELRGFSGGLRRLADRALHLTRRNTRRGAKRNIRAHYDLGNDFYRLFLDPSMTYSAAVFPSEEASLEAAQREKYRRLADRAGVRVGDHVLEIGCGWGGFAEYAAGELGCRVTGITLSLEQAAFARERMARAGLDDRVEIRVVDYRDLDGRFDAIVSIEMLEAVGHEWLGEYFATCDRLLAPGGRAAIQVITIPDQIYDRYRRSSDWIRKHIFPGGHLPSLGAMQRAIADRSSFVVEQVENIGLHYAETLRRWRLAFMRRLDEVQALGFDQRFVRMWEFYLGSCEAAFAHRKLGSLQLVLARPGEARGPAAVYRGGDAP